MQQTIMLDLSASPYVGRPTCSSSKAFCADSLWYMLTCMRQSARPKRKHVAVMLKAVVLLCRCMARSQCQPCPPAMARLAHRQLKTLMATCQARFRVHSAQLIHRMSRMRSPLLQIRTMSPMHRHSRTHLARSLTARVIQLTIPQASSQRLTWVRHPADGPVHALTSSTRLTRTHIVLQRHFRSGIPIGTTASTRRAAHSPRASGGWESLRRLHMRTCR